MAWGPEHSAKPPAATRRLTRPPTAPDPVYFDYNATTPLDPEVRAVMADVEQRVFANPSSIHRLGREARARLDEARERVASAWGCRPTEVVFTSGATEANSLAVLGTARRRRSRGGHIVCSRIEHPSVIEAVRHLERRDGFRVTWVAPRQDGTVSAAAMLNAVESDTVLVTLMAANNEIGTLQPVAEVGTGCRARGIPFHTDAAQWLGKLPCTRIADFQADLVSVCAHKFHGPRGAGALYVRGGMAPEPLMFGGGQENDQRAGTENLPAIVGLAEAIERFAVAPVFAVPGIVRLTQRLRQAARRWPATRLLGAEPGLLPNTVAVAVEGADATALIAALDLTGICASSGSACSAGALVPSHVLTALALEPPMERGLVRFSLGRESTAAEVERLEQTMPKIIQQVLERGREAGNL